jgi:transcriptional regulator with XRE-family HTH domain
MTDDQAAGVPLPPAGAADERVAASFSRYLAVSGMSQGELARRMSAAGWPWAQQTVSRVLDGRRKLGVGEADAVAHAFGTTVERMLMPGPESEAVGELEPATADANRAWERILHSARDLAAAQARLRGAVARAESAAYHESETVRRLAENARRAIALDPRDAAGAWEGSTEGE